MPSPIILSSLAVQAKYNTSVSICPHFVFVQPKKRQVMRNTFGDYRKSMAADLRKSKGNCLLVCIPLVSTTRKVEQSTMKARYSQIKTRNIIG